MRWGTTYLGSITIAVAGLGGDGVPVDLRLVLLMADDSQEETSLLVGGFLGRVRHIVGCSEVSGDGVYDVDLGAGAVSRPAGRL